MCLWVGIFLGYFIGLIVGVILHYLLVIIKENDDANSKRKPF